MFQSEQLEKKWAPILEAADAPAFADPQRKAVTAVLLENQEKALKESRAQSNYLVEATETDNVASSIDTWDPVLISLVRRSMPSLVSYDVAGVQPMTGPTGLIFAMKARYQTSASLDTTNDTPTPTDEVTDGDEALFNTIHQEYSGPQTTAVGETSAGTISREMGFTVEKLQVLAKTRALKAEYTMELAQDLKAVHGRDAEAELANILSTEILAEINREVIDAINTVATPGATLNSPGVFDLHADTDGRWAVERYKALLFQLEIEANEIAKGTRRGKGNFVLCSSNVASALAAAGVLDYAPQLSTNLNVDDTGQTFAGLINGRLKVFVDPFATSDYATVGYKGSNAYDAGIFYCPYVPLTMMRATGENDFQPKIGFKTRYGLVANPLAEASGALTADTNPYFRTFTVDGILGAGA